MDQFVPRLFARDPAGATRRQATGLLAATTAALLGLAGTSDARRRKTKKTEKKHRSRRKQDADGGKSGHVALGAYVPRALDDPNVRKDFAKAIGRDPDYLVWYEDWANGNFGSEQRAYLRTFDEAKLIPVIAWDPFDADGDAINQPTYRLSRISNGNFDGYIDGWAKGLVDYGKPVFLNFGHEMNGGWTPWGVGVNGNQKGDFARAWRHIHDRFAAKGARNVRWIWAPNIVFDGVPVSLRDVYPGDNYVDWLGMDGYNWGTSVYWESCPCRSSWQSFAEIFDKTYKQLVALADKPIMIGEMASSDEGGDKADWIEDALLKQLPNTYPRVRAITWFNKKATGLDTVGPGKVEPTAKVDWRIESSASARKAFARAVQDAYYDGSLKGP